MLKRYILGLFVALSVPMLVANAAPSLTFNGMGSTGTNSSASVNVSGGERNSSVVLYYTDQSGYQQSRVIGTTDANGTFSGSVDATSWSFNQSMPVYVMVNGQQSSSVNWLNNSTNTSANTTNSSSLMFSQTNPSLSMGQNSAITLSGVAGPYYIASNSNQAGIGATISGNTLNLSGLQNGSGSLIICSSSMGTCGTLNVNAGTSGNTTTSGAPMLSQSNINVTQGQSGTISLSGGSGPYTVKVVNGTGVSTVLTGNTLAINGNATGTNVIHVCSANNGACTPINVSVVAQAQTNTNTNTNSSPMSFTLSLPYSSTAKLMLNGGNGGYYLQSQSSSPIMASISGNVLTMLGSGYGSGTLTICSAGSSTCMPLNITVDQSAQPPLTGTGGTYTFSTNLSMGMSGQDVMELQTRLKAEGHFTGTPTGYFGSMTAAAVRAYQIANGISAVGQVGPQTRAMLNQ